MQANWNGFMATPQRHEIDMNTPSPYAGDVIKSRHVIFLPVHNGGRYIRSAIDSVLSQSFTDWLLVVLENGSSDDTLNIVRSYRDPRILVMPAESDLGIEQNWSRVHQVLQQGEIQGQFATLIGHDDILYPSFLDAIEELHFQYPDVGVYQVMFDLIDEKGQPIRPCRPIPLRESAEDFLAFRGWGLRDSFGTGYVFRVDQYLNIGGIPALPLLLFADDLLFARLAITSGKVCTSDFHCAYRLHQGSTSGSLSRKRASAMIQALWLYLQCIKEHFPNYWTSNRGRAAISCLIAREALLFRSSWLIWSFEQTDKSTLASLESLYTSFSNGIIPGRWTNINGLIQRIYEVSRTSRWFFIFLYDRYKQFK